ncbi:hypothetical protein LS70_002340 [Helicobacter sp. MIT 11-5569]|uniref:hypothetical protein n=1 Tax=Helicobacter sp. MIT 11-5569 TaxID=1548151 RepID=UPI00051FAFE9|nr:hypothetical protein [Helicobacter sp. MIT 11-5569]TLD84406.1 hypothetical protein LS70_002340 [Helicobacter sp. MIT 11-5569]
MKKIIILLTLLISIVWANTGDGGGKAPTTTAQELKKILPNDDQVVNGTCSWKCRSVSGGYVTQISGFDFKSGTTYCRIYSRENLDEALLLMLQVNV